jgi:RNA polymerase sigma-70 factor (ECF subfamily)
MNQDDFLPTRDSLIGRLRNWEDQDSWQVFFDTYWKFIYGVAIKAGLSETEAQDVVQETVVTVAKKIKDFQIGAEHGSFKAWLVRTTKWRIADQFRKRGRLAELTEPPSETIGRTSVMERVPDDAAVLEADRALDQDWEQNLLDVAVEKIRRNAGNEEFQLFHLHVVKGWPATKVAESVGVKLSQVYDAKYKLLPLVQREVERLKKELI